MEDIQYRHYEGMPDDDVWAWLAGLGQVISGVHNVNVFRDAYTSRQKQFTLLAFDGDTPVGYKLGFLERPHYFESWQGGVLKDYRRQGIARELLRRQHAWCQEQGFRIISTTTNNQNIPMLLLNLQQGFVVVGTIFDRRDHMKVLLQKHLDPTA
jgi:GNAT superfamily N-acetyltransferase